MSLSFGQWAKLIFSGPPLIAKHHDAIVAIKHILNNDWPIIKPLIDDVLGLLEETSAEAKPEAPKLTHDEAMQKIKTNDFTPEEKALFDRASQGPGVG